MALALIVPAAAPTAGGPLCTVAAANGRPGSSPATLEASQTGSHGVSSSRLTVAVAAAVVAAGRRSTHRRAPKPNVHRGDRAARPAGAGLDQFQKPGLLSFLQAVEGVLGRELENPIMEGNFAPVREEISAPRLELLEGAVPHDFPDGFYVRNGPNPHFKTTNRESPLGRSVHHWFEGDGMLHQVSFSGGSASYRNRYVRTGDFLKEEAAGELLLRPVFQASPPTSLLNALVNREVYGARGKELANTNVVWHAGRLLAMAEGAPLPTQVDPTDLSAVGLIDFGATKPLPSFTAHPKVDPNTGELVFAAWSFNDAQSGRLGVHVGVVGPDGVIKHSADIPSADRNTFMHDVAITEKWIVIPDFPLTLDPSRLLSDEGMISFEEGAPARIGLMPRYGDDVEHWFEVRSGYGFHLMNAYEDGDDVVLRGVFADSADLSYEWEADGTVDRERYVRGFFQDGSATKASKTGPRLREWRLNLPSGSVTERAIGLGNFVDFPVINPRFVGRQNRHGYCAGFDASRTVEFGYGSLLMGSIEKYTFRDDGEVVTEQRVLPHGSAGQEVAFVQRPGSELEDDGWLVMFVHDMVTDKSEFHIIDAQRMDAPPVARLALPQRVPFGFHGCWVPG